MLDTCFCFSQATVFAKSDSSQPVLHVVAPTGSECLQVSAAADDVAIALNCSKCLFRSFTSSAVALPLCERFQSDDNELYMVTPVMTTVSLLSL